MLPYFEMHSTPRLTSSRSSVTTVCIVRDLKSWPMCIFRVGIERVLNSPLNLKVYVTSPTLAQNGRLMTLSLPPSSSSPCNYIKNLSFLPGCHTPFATPVMTGHEKQRTASPAENEVAFRQQPKDDKQEIPCYSQYPRGPVVSPALHKDIYSLSNTVF